MEPPVRIELLNRRWSRGRYGCDLRNDILFDSLGIALVCAQVPKMCPVQAQGSPASHACNVCCDTRPSRRPAAPTARHAHVKPRVYYAASVEEI
jgi:hypothetical protein